MQLLIHNGSLCRVMRTDSVRVAGGTMKRREQRRSRPAGKPPSIACHARRKENFQPSQTRAFTAHWKRGGSAPENRSQFPFPAMEKMFRKLRRVTYRMHALRNSSAIDPLKWDCHANQRGLALASPITRPRLSPTRSSLVRLRADTMKASPSSTARKESFVALFSALIMRGCLQGRAFKTCLSLQPQSNL
jgi:hypothetical protein